MTSLKIIGSLVGFALLVSCASVNVSEPKSAQNRAAGGPPYPPVVEVSAARQQAAEEAWSNFLSEHRLNFVKPDLDPVLYTPHALPLDLANQLNIKPVGAKADEPVDEMKAKDLLRAFIERSHAVLSGDSRASALTLKDLSLTAFSGDANSYRAVYRQMNYPFPIANGYGELRFVISKAGNLLQMSSTLLPPVEFPARPALDRAALTDKLVGREFTYSNIAGQPLSYKVTARDEVKIKDAVVYPKLEQNKLTLYLAYPVEVGRGTTWTVYFDAINGQEIDAKQNFAS